MNNETSDGGATVPCISLLGGPHRCDTCAKEFPTCDAVKIVWGIDRDPSARGADADKVLECDAYTPNDKDKPHLAAALRDRFQDKPDRCQMSA